MRFDYVGNKRFCVRISCELVSLKVWMSVLVLRRKAAEGWFNWEEAIAMVEKYRHDESRKEELKKMERIKWNASRGWCWVPTVGECPAAAKHNMRSWPWLGSGWGQGPQPSAAGMHRELLQALLLSILPLSLSQSPPCLLRPPWTPPQGWGSPFPHRGCLYPEQHIWSLKKTPNNH